MTREKKAPKMKEIISRFFDYVLLVKFIEVKLYSLYLVTSVYLLAYTFANHLGTCLSYVCPIF